MSAKGLKGLKQAAEAGPLAGLTVTPELKAGLWRRIRQEEQHGNTPAPVRYDGNTPAPGHSDADTPAPELPRRHDHASGRPRLPWLRPAGWTTAAAVLVALALLAGSRPPAMGSLVAGDGAAGRPAPLPMPYSQAGSRPQEVSVTRLEAGVQGSANGITSFSSAAKIMLSDADSAPADPYGASAAMAPQAAAEAQPGRRIITNGEYGIRVTDARAAMDRLQSEALAAGGYVAEASLNKEANDSWTGRIVLRVPTANAPGTIRTLGQIGTVERERQWTQDVTDQWMDLEHRVAIQTEHEKRLRELADKAATFDDWNKLATQINNTRVEIENMTGRLKLLANQVEYAILNIQLLQPAPGEPAVIQGATTLSGQIGEAFSNSVGRIGALARQLILGLAAIAPFGLPLLAAVAGVWSLLRRRRTEGS